MMEEFSDNDLEKQLREAAEDLQLKPSAKVWAALGDELHPRRKSYPLWWAAAGVLLIVGLGLWVLLRNDAGSFGTPPERPQSQTSAGNFAREVPPSKAPAKAGGHTGVTKGAPQVKAGQPVQALPFSGYVPARHSAAQRGPSVLSGQNTMGRQAFASRQGSGETVWLPSLKSLPSRFSATISGASPAMARIWPSPLAQDVVTPAHQRQRPPEEKPVATLKVRPPQKPAFEVFFTSGIGYRTLKTTAPAPTPSMAPGLMSLSYRAQAVRPPLAVKIRQHPAWSWRAGAAVIFPLERQWFLRSGVSLAKTGYNILAYGTYPAYVEHRTTSYADPVGNINSSLTTNPIVADTRKPSFVHSSYLAAEIPLMIGRQFGDAAKVSYSIGAGADLSYLVGSHAVIYSPESKRYFTDKDYVRPFNGGLDLQATINIPLNRQWRISVGPSFQYQLFSTYKNYPLVKEHPYLLGIKTALQLIR
jgi:hypothetical protein